MLQARCGSSEDIGDRVSNRFVYEDKKSNDICRWDVTMFEGHLQRETTLPYKKEVEDRTLGFLGFKLWLCCKKR